MSDNAAGAIAYLTIIPAIIFLVLEPYSKNRFVRFHSFQCIALTVVSVIGQIGILIMQTVLHFIPVISFLIGSIVGLVFGLVIFIAWLIAIIKASQGVKYKLPFIGDYAEKLADGGSL